MKEKTYVEDIDRNIYDFKYDDKDAYKLKAGLTPEIVEQLSKEKHDPAWMQNFRLESLQIYNNMQVPDWGPSIEGLDIDNIVTYVRPNTKMKGSWDEVPEDIKDTFERLGIPQAERKSLAGVGAQYDSELVYHNVRQEVADMGESARFPRYGQSQELSPHQAPAATASPDGEAFVVVAACRLTSSPANPPSSSGRQTRSLPPASNPKYADSACFLPA